MLEPREDDIRSLTALSKSAAAYVARDGFNPGTMPEDRIRDVLFRKKYAELKQLDEATRIAGTRQSESSDKAARRRALVGKKPDLPVLVMVAAVGVLAISVAPTLHDYIFHTLPDDVLNWFLSIAVSALLGVMLAWGLFAASVTNSRTPILVGIVISIGLGALRISAAENVQEVVFAIGLALIEVGVVLFLDWRAGIYNRTVAGWLGRGQEADEAEAASGVQYREYVRLLGEKNKLEAQIFEHVSYIERREELPRDSSAREQAFIEAVCDSYLQGVAENRGRLQRVE